MRILHLFAATSLAAAPVLTACSDSSGEAPPDGPGIALSVAPLDLPGIGFACYDVLVENEAGDPVWSRGDPAVSYPDDPTTLCSTRFGNGAGGDISYVGPCDASQPEHTVTLWVDGLYDADGADLGDYQDPCPAAGCTATVDCAENADTPVVFNFTVMRAAQQGFFDLAVNFDNIFCSAKFDTCYPDSEGVPTTPITLLHGPDGQRQHTGIAAVACTAGPGAAIETTLHMAGWQVGCNLTAPEAAQVWYYLAPLGPEGNGIIDPYFAPSGSDHPLRYGLYYGDEDLNCGGASCNKAYWNIALNLGDLAAQGLHDCYLYGMATASPGPTSAPFFGTENITDPTGGGSFTSYPAITFGDTAWLSGPPEGYFGGIPLVGAPGADSAPAEVICAQHPVNTEGSGVQTEYAEDFEVEFWWDGFCYNLSPGGGEPFHLFEECDAWGFEVWENAREKYEQANTGG